MIADLFLQPLVRTKGYQQLNQALPKSKGKPAAIGTPSQLISGIREKVYEICGTYDEINTLKKDYGKGQIYQTEKGYVLRIVADEKPCGFQNTSGNITLEDVYLYYAEGRT